MATEEEIRTHIEALCADKDWVKSFNSKLKRVKSGEHKGCLEWQGGLDKGGYGRFHVKKHHETGTGRNFFAHRMSYMINRGYITPDELILHQCHNRLCCNPSHHKLGDHIDNMDDLHDSKRIAGENNPRSKLREDEVWDILSLYYDGIEPIYEPLSIGDIVKLYEDVGIKRGTVSDIVYGRTWPYVYNEFFEEEDE